MVDLDGTNGQRTRRVGVTGAAGKTGRAVIQSLSSAGLAVTALVHRHEQAEAVEAAGATDVRVVDMADGAGLEAALRDHHGVYHVPPNMHPDETTLTGVVVQAAQRAGIRRFVLHSVLAPYIPDMAHHLRKAASEEQLRRSRLDWTVLQPAPYAQNILGYLPDARSGRRLLVPYSVGARFNVVDLYDVAQVAAAVLTAPGHSDATYELCGPEVLDTSGMARALGDVLGHPVTAGTMPLQEWRATAKLPPGEREDLAAMFAYYDRHGLLGGSQVLGHLLGRPPTTFATAIRREIVCSA